MSLEELIKKCAEGDPAAWEEFMQRFHKLIAVVVLRTTQRWGRSSPALVDDLIQDTYVKLYACRERLPSEFNPQGPDTFLGFLAVVTKHLVDDYFRAQHSQKRGSGKPDDSIDANEEVAHAAATNRPAEEVYRNLQLLEVERALSLCIEGMEPERDRTIFWLYYRDGLSAAKIARLPSILLKVKGVESVIHRLTRCVRERLA